ncbi:MAG: SDR family NAD(P)-dependent oxidoreductase [Segniliparus sp.]|uniref:SDR family NAD(P)-dependent oxidoreductase n=1 Tax=Segniliparus sp. TaxID=2804064 RepID=UPI003F31BC4D
MVKRAKPIQPDGAVVVITGAARGIGRAAAELLASLGSTVWIGDVDADVAAEAAAAISGKHGAIVRSAHLDVTSPESWHAFVSAVNEVSGPIDVLVNNAGVMPLGAFEQEPWATTDLILDVNVRGVLAGMRAVLPSMLARGHGHIVNVASLFGVVVAPGAVTYNASKFAAVGLSLAARAEYRGTGVTVSTILPSAVNTELASGAAMPLSSLLKVEPEDVAKAIAATLRHRRARASVPGWLFYPASLLAFLPEAVVNFGRRIIDDRRTLKTDPVGRRAYQERIDRQAGKHAAETGELR